MAQPGQPHSNPRPWRPQTTTSDLIPADCSLPMVVSANRLVRMANEQRRERQDQDHRAMMRRHRSTIALAILVSYLLAGGVSLHYAGADLMCVAKVCLGDPAACCDVDGSSISFERGAAATVASAAGQSAARGSCCASEVEITGMKSADQCGMVAAGSSSDHAACCSDSFRMTDHCPSHGQGQSDHSHFPFCPGHCPVCGQGKVVVVILSNAWRPIPQCVGWVTADLWFAPVEGASHDLLRPPIA